MSISLFSFRRNPDDLTRAKSVTNLCRTEVLKVAVQVVRRGGENNLHSHPNRDEIFYVLAGRVRFYTTDDEVVGELGPNDGILVQRGDQYWFESIGDTELELLQVAVADSPVPRDATFGGRVNHVARVDGRAEERIVGGR